MARKEKITSRKKKGEGELLFEGRPLNLERKLRKLRNTNFYQELAKLPVSDQYDFVSEYLPKSVEYLRKNHQLAVYAIAWFFPRKHNVHKFASLMDLLFETFYPKWASVKVFTSRTIDLGLYLHDWPQTGLLEDILEIDVLLEGVYEYFDDLTLFYLKTILNIFVNNHRISRFTYIRRQATAYSYPLYEKFIKEFKLDLPMTWDSYVAFMNTFYIWPIRG